MFPYQEHVSGKRSQERIALECSLTLANGKQVGEARILNLSKGGCLGVVDGTFPVNVKVGDGLQLRLSLSGTDQSICVSVAIVRWVEGPRFGVEFRTVDEKYRARLHQFIALQQKDIWKLAL
ncbi:MAG: PilZ domain-containing protein [Nitrospirota bacterium]|nr:PilZ domain-containing protein [Nitrospirota bacterium]